MAQELKDVLELAALLRPDWHLISDAIPAWHPRCETPPKPDPADPPADPEDDPDDPEDDPDDPADPPAAAEVDWKRQARKHERAAKKALDRAAKLDKQLQDRTAADQSEHEKAIEEARKSARSELQAQHDAERRQDRLEAATARTAGKGLKVGTGDNIKTVRFADPDDALLHLEREMRNGDLDPDDIFDATGRVRADALEEALADLLERKPHLGAAATAGGNGGGTRKTSGSADGGKGGPSKTDSSVDDEFNKIRRHKPRA